MNTSNKDRKTANSTVNYSYFSSRSIFGRLNYMKPTEIKQYLFRISSLDPSKPLPKPLTIGKLDIVWRNPFSDIGRLQTNQLTHPVRFSDIIICN
jgi:hypothetical protein